MSVLDWIIVAAYLAIVLIIGFAFKRRADGNTSRFFVAGRSLGWFVAGSSMAAATFSSDTPLFVAGMSRADGIFSNWFWWSVAIGHIGSVFLFSRLWRRSEVMTAVEFYTKRYEPGVATVGLRLYGVFFGGVLINCIVMASVTLALGKLLPSILGIPAGATVQLPLVGSTDLTFLIVVILSIYTVGYTMLSGLYGGAYTNLLQFALAMFGSISLVIVVLAAIDREPSLVTQISQAADFKPDTLAFFPDLSALNLKSVSFMILITVAWWQYAASGDAIVQRLLAARTERDALLSSLWFCICHYVLRPWPWIVVGLVSMIYFPALADPETAYPEMIARFMPTGLKGLMVVAMLAAYMSTIDTQLNWGASYLVNDFYRPYVAKTRSETHYVGVARIFIILLMVLVLLISARLTSILSTYKYLQVIGSGGALLIVMRWYWWRINAWSEIAALFTSLVFGNWCIFNIPDLPGEDRFAIRLIVNLALTTLVWVSVAYLTSRKPQPNTMAFYRQMRIGGIGWRRVARATGISAKDSELKHALVQWALCIFMLYSALFSVGEFILGDVTTGTLLLIIAVLSGWVLGRVFSRVKFT